MRLSTSIINRPPGEPAFEVIATTTPLLACPAHRLDDDWRALRVQIGMRDGGICEGLDFAVGILAGEKLCEGLEFSELRGGPDGRKIGGRLRGTRRLRPGGEGAGPTTVRPDAFVSRQFRRARRYLVTGTFSTLQLCVRCLDCRSDEHLEPARGEFHAARAVFASGPPDPMTRISDALPGRLLRRVSGPGMTGGGVPSDGSGGNPVSTMARLCSSAAAMTSASRIGAARLDHRGGAGFGEHVEAVAEREERRGRHASADGARPAFPLDPGDGPSRRGSSGPRRRRRSLSAIDDSVRIHELGDLRQANSRSPSSCRLGALVTSLRSAALTGGRRRLHQQPKPPTWRLKSVWRTIAERHREDAYIGPWAEVRALVGIAGAISSSRNWR